MSKRKHIKKNRVKPKSDCNNPIAELKRIRSMEKTPSQRYEGIYYPFEIIAAPSDGSGRRLSFFAKNDKEFEDLVNLLFGKYGHGIQSVAFIPSN